MLGLGRILPSPSRTTSEGEDFEELVFEGG